MSFHEIQQAVRRWFQYLCDLLVALAALIPFLIAWCLDKWKRLTEGPPCDPPDKDAKSGEAVLLTAFGFLVTNAGALELAKRLGYLKTPVLQIGFLLSASAVIIVFVIMRTLRRRVPQANQPRAYHDLATIELGRVVLFLSVVVTFLFVGIFLNNPDLKLRHQHQTEVVELGKPTRIDDKQTQFLGRMLVDQDLRAFQGWVNTLPQMLELKTFNKNQVVYLQSIESPPFDDDYRPIVCELRPTPALHDTIVLALLVKSQPASPFPLVQLLPYQLGKHSIPSTWFRIDAPDKGAFLLILFLSEADVDKTAYRMAITPADTLSPQTEE